MEKVLKLYKQTDDITYLLAEIGVLILTEDGIGISTEKTYKAFPKGGEQITITEFEYNANRMGRTPSITATVMHKECLDDFWDETVFAEFNGEKYYVMNTPSSSKDNTDARYKHELELLSEREILNHVYFIDAVQEDETIDKVKSNTTNVQFMGDINEFVARLNSSLSYSNLGYSVVVDEGVSTENVLVSFEDKYFYEALQEGYELYEVPFYFEGKTIHFGYTEDVIPNVFKYGHNNALLSISKENANYKIVTRCTGYGSSDNIPYYYPNATAKGDVKAVAGASNAGLQQSNIRLANNVLFSEKFNSTDSLKWSWINDSGCVELADVETKVSPILSKWTSVKNSGFNVILTKDGLGRWVGSKTMRVTVNIVKEGQINFDYMINGLESSMVFVATTGDTGYNGYSAPTEIVQEFTLSFSKLASIYDGNATALEYKCTLGLDIKEQTTKGWLLNEEGSAVNISNYGLELLNITEDELAIGDTITQRVGSLIPSTGCLMPPIYRQSSGAEQFYNAQNDKYPLPEGEGYYTFENEYDELNPHEMKVSFEDIKPSIVGMTNSLGQRIDKFLAFAWDDDDNDEVNTDGEYIHPYFFAKLPKTDGEFGFNLFDHASESGNMTISMTSGTCGACSFEIGVGEKSNQNTVQVDEHGNLLKDENGDIRCGRDGKPAEEPQPRQQDTENYEVWIALKKDESTYSTILPSKQQNLIPSTDDTFVITNINLPQAYIDAAEQKLEDEIIKYMSENNVEKFNFEIAFSRIYLAENPDVLAMLDENARIIIEYNGQQHTLYVDSYTYKMSSDEALPEINVTLADTLNVGTNSLRNAIESVTKEIMSGPNGDILAQGSRYFLRKDVEDSALKTITFEQGIKTNSITSKNFTSGTLGTGYKIFIDPDTGESYCELDRLYVRMKAYFDTLEIKEVSHIGGELLLTPASMKCSKVETIGGYSNTYRCYFSSDDGEEAIKNQFVVGDLAYCRQFNIDSGVYTNVSNRFYWYEVVGVGEDYIEVVEGKCSEGSDIPQEGDTIVSLGNKTDAFRQNAIILSTVGANAPSKTLYQGIDDYSLDGKAIIEEGFDTESNQAYQKIYGKTYIGAKDESSYISFDPNENKMKIKAEVEITSGVGFNNFEDKPDIDAINQSIEDAKELAENAQATAEQANSAVSDLESNVEGAFKDGIISEAEAIAISKYINQVNESFNNIQATYTEVYNNTYLKGTAKNTLKTKYDALVVKKDALLNAINTAIADGKTTSEESAAVDTAFTNFNIATKEYQTSIEQANEAIQDKLKSYADNAQLTAEKAKEIANTAKELAENASTVGVYGQESYNQTSNPWNSWNSGTEYKHVGALWYNPNTGVTQVYTGTDNSNSWETINTSNYATTSYFLQNSDKISAVVANFDSSGNPTTASGIITEAYGNSLWASVDLENGEELISRINQTASTIAIDASKISLNGYTVVNGGFEIMADGSFECWRGKIGGWSIQDNNLVCSGFNTSINVEASGSRFMRINDSEDTMCSIRGDGNTCLHLSTYGTDNNTKGLVVLCNAAGYGKAIEAYGNVTLHARPDENVSIKGLMLNIRAVSTSQDVLRNDDYLLCSGNITIKFPTPQSSQGKVYHIRRSSGTITLSSYYMSGSAIKPFFFADGRNDYSTEIVTNELHTYISNGIAWYELKSL